MIAVVVGAQGNLGRPLVDLLKSRDIEVISIVRSCSSISPSESLSWNAFVNDPHSVPERCDKLIFSFGNLTTSVEESLNVIEWSIRRAAKAGCNQVIFLSSLKVLKQSDNNHLISDTSIVEPTDNYGRMKYVSELKVAQMCERYDISYCVLRLPLVLGVDALNPNLLALARVCGKLPPVGRWGYSLFRRSVLAVEDFCSLIYACMLNPDRYKGSWVISNGDSPVNLQLVSMWAKGKRLVALADSDHTRPIPNGWPHFIFLVYPASQPLEASTELSIFDCGWRPVHRTHDIIRELPI